MKPTFKTAVKNDWGILDVDPSEVFEKRGSIKIIDVRRPEEFTGELGHIEGAELVTLDNLDQELPKLPKDASYVFVCRSGARSTRAGQYAESLGFKSVYNMRGGMLLWNELGLAIAK
ncbi:MAG TPA: rhodanese-like domain-containing protein [Bdellovibrionales bacterium]|nr:rhodanese-like domain-containing protein [Bdellovibrionales bacterium]